MAGYYEGCVNYARTKLNIVVPPEQRQKAYTATTSFAQERPLLFVSNAPNPLAHSHPGTRGVSN